MTETCDPVYFTLESEDCSLADLSNPSSGEADRNREFANVRISHMSDKMLDQQEDEFTESTYDQIPTYAVVDKSKKITNELPEYAMVDKSQKRKSVASLKSKSEKPHDEELSTLVDNEIVEKKKNNRPFSEFALQEVTESTISMPNKEFPPVEEQQQKESQNEDKSMQHSNKNLCNLSNKWCTLLFVIIAMLVIVLAFIILAYLSILQLKPMQEICFNTTSNLEKLLNAHLGNLSHASTSASINTTILEHILHQYLSVYKPNESCTLTCTTNEQSTTSVPITSVPAVNTSCITTQSVTMTPRTSMYCGGNYSNIVNSSTWRRVADLNMTIPNTQCPINLIMYNTSGLRTCTRMNYDHNCTSVYFHTNANYSRIFGGIRAYQYMRTNSFQQFKRGNGTIDDPYVDGVSLTYGSPRQHIWTFASDISQTNSHCPCGNLQSSTPNFVGEDYFCDSGVQDDSSNFILAFNNPLWDGRGCREGYNCCQYNNPPWFCKQLSNSTSEPIELRICSDQTNSNEDIAIETIHLFVHE